MKAKELAALLLKNPEAEVVMWDEQGQSYYPVAIDGEIEMTYEQIYCEKILMPAKGGDVKAIVLYADEFKPDAEDDSYIGDDIDAFADEMLAWEGKL